MKNKQKNINIEIDAQRYLLFATFLFFFLLFFKSLCSPGRGTDVELQEGLLPVFCGERLQRIQIDKGYRTIGIIDGSCMGNQYLSAFVLSGKVEYPLVIENCRRRGKELPVSEVLLEKAQKLLGDAFPQLILFDALYFCENNFKRVREKGAHLLIKCKDPEFREVFKDAKFIFDAKDEVTDKVTTANGFDSMRMCNWKIEITSGDFAGYPVNIAHLVEDYPHASEDKSHIECWIVTTDLSLTPNEIRETGYNGWLRGACADRSRLRGWKTPPLAHRK